MQFNNSQILFLDTLLLTKSDIYQNNPKNSSELNLARNMRLEPTRPFDHRRGTLNLILKEYRALKKMLK
jgi:hypothetical protein